MAYIEWQCMSVCCGFMTISNERLTTCPRCGAAVRGYSDEEPLADVGADDDSD